MFQRKRKVRFFFFKYIKKNSDDAYILNRGHTDESFVEEIVQPLN